MFEALNLVEKKAGLLTKHVLRRTGDLILKRPLELKSVSFQIREAAKNDELKALVRPTFPGSTQHELSISFGQKKIVLQQKQGTKNNALFSAADGSLKFRATTNSFGRVTTLKPASFLGGSCLLKSQRSGTGSGLTNLAKASLPAGLRPATAEYRDYQKLPAARQMAVAAKAGKLFAEVEQERDNPLLTLEYNGHKDFANFVTQISESQSVYATESGNVLISVDQDGMVQTVAPLIKFTPGQDGVNLKTAKPLPVSRDLLRLSAHRFKDFLASRNELATFEPTAFKPNESIGILNREAHDGRFDEVLTVYGRDKAVKYDVQPAVDPVFEQRSSKISTFKEPLTFKEREYSPQDKKVTIDLADPGSKIIQTISSRVHVNLPRNLEVDRARRSRESTDTSVIGRRLRLKKGNAIRFRDAQLGEDAICVFDKSGDFTKYGLAGPDKVEQVAGKSLLVFEHPIRKSQDLYLEEASRKLYQKVQNAQGQPELRRVGNTESETHELHEEHQHAIKELLSRQNRGAQTRVSHLPVRTIAEPKANRWKSWGSGRYEAIKSLGKSLGKNALELTVGRRA